MPSWSMNKITIKAKNKQKLNELKNKLDIVKKEQRYPAKKMTYYGVLGALTDAKVDHTKIDYGDSFERRKKYSLLRDLLGEYDEDRKKISPTTFNIKNIGTKWDINPNEAKIKQIKNGLVIEAPTAWTHPDIALQTLASKGYNVKVDAYNEMDGKLSTYHCDKSMCRLKKTKTPTEKEVNRLYKEQGLL